MTLEQIRRKVENLQATYTRARQRVREERASLALAESRLADSLTAREVIQEAARLTQVAAHSKVAGVVTRCLRAVFGGSTEFCIHFDRKRGRTEARMTFRDGGRETDPADADSGGMMDVAALALRVACLAMARPRCRRLLVLDEPLRFVHGQGNRERVAELLLTLAREFQVQIILATGLKYLEVGHVVNLGGGP